VSDDLHAGHGRPGPDFDELVGGGDLAPDEAARLERVHDLLVFAGPPPELSPRSEAPQEDEPNVFPLFPRRRAAATIVLAAAIAIAAFGAGFLVGGRSASDDPERVLVMVAPSGASSPAHASLALFQVDEAGNWPMELTVNDLPTLPEGQTYALWLTRGGQLADPCGVFSVLPSGATVVPFNAPYKLREYDGWVVVRSGTEEPVLTT
jgi:anti-sigma-K factor RskA